MPDKNPTPKNLTKNQTKNQIPKKSKADLWAIVILIILILDLQFFGMFGRTTFIRDWTIVFEGAYRVSLGQIPFQDFFIPIGPVVFYMQTFFNLIFGTNILSMIIHSFILSITLSLIFYYFARKEFKPLTSFVFAFFLYLSFSGLSFHPFYNYTTYFFLFLNIFLILYHIKKESLPTYIYLLSAILGVLDFYTKQDTGALHLTLIFAYFIFNYRKDWKKIILAYLLPSIILLAGTFLALSTLSGFPYWFNLGQPPHNPNIQKFFDPLKIVQITSSWHLYIAILFIFFVLFTKINTDKKRIMSLFIVLALTHLISNTLSGSTRQLSVIGLPILIFFIYLLIKPYIKNLQKNHKIPMFLILLFILLMNVNPIPTYGLITLNYLNPNITHVQEGCLKGMPIEKQHLEGLQELREIIKQNPNFISLTEYNFLYCDYNIQPPTQIPLVFREGIHFYLQDIEPIANTILKQNPPLILIQNYHGHNHPDTHEKFINLFKEAGYKEIRVIDKTPSVGPITVLKKG